VIELCVYFFCIERAKITVATMGSAIINGGFSTFLAFILLAFILLATSNSYVFITFFKVSVVTINNHSLKL